MSAEQGGALITAFATFNRTTADRIAEVYGDVLVLTQLVPLDLATMQVDAASFVQGAAVALCALARPEMHLPSVLLEILEAAK